MGQRVSLQEELINMKITSKQMVSASKKCEKNEKKYRKDVKKARSPRFEVLRRLHFIQTRRLRE